MSMDGWRANSNGYWYQNGKAHPDELRVNIVAAYIESEVLFFCDRLAATAPSE